MSTQTDPLEHQVRRILVEARALEGLTDAIEPLLVRIPVVWEGPAADRLVSELAGRRRELRALAWFLRERARRLSQDIARSSLQPSVSSGFDPLVPASR